MMDTLEYFQTELDRRGIEVVQDFPRSCMIVEEGVVNGPLGDISPVRTLGHAEPGARQ
jgi:hypothetical protein